MASTDGGTAAVRRRNARDCLLMLRQSSAPQTVTDIAAVTGLSRTTTTSVLGSLEAAGCVRALDPAASAGRGRPARRFRFEPSAGVVAGIDLGAHSVRCLLTDAAGAVLATTSAAASPGTHLDVAAELLTSSELPGPATVGVAVPGILGADGQLLRSLALPDLVGTNIAASLSARLGCPVAAENDIKLAALAEQRLGPGPDDMVLLQLGHRVSVAIIVGGRILQGSNRLAGELGSQRGMRWTDTSERGRLRWSTGDDAAPLFALAAEGDAAALAEIDAFCAQIAPRLAALALTVDPAVIVVGGGLSRAGDLLLDPLRRHVQHLLMTPSWPDLVTARLTTDGAVTGALGLGFDHGSSDLFSVDGVPPPWDRLRAQLVGPP